jgi:ABC-type transport system substrate-binding protein
VIKLKEPDATVMQQLATDRIGTMYILPKEAGDKFDPDRDAFGPGPFYILPDKSEISYRWKKNPNFKRAKLKDNEPYLDEIYEPVIPDTATGTALFRTGAIYWYGVPRRKCQDEARQYGAGDAPRHRDHGTGAHLLRQ